LQRANVKHQLWCVVLLTLFSSNTLGQSNQNLNQLTGQAGGDENSYTVTLSQSFSSSTHKPDDVNHSATADTNLTVIGSDKFGNNYTLRLNGTKELTNQREFDLLDGTVRVSRLIYRRKEFMSLVRSTVMLPMSELTKDDRQTITSLSVSLSNIYTPRNVPGLALIYIPNAARFFNRYTMSLTGLSNFKYRIGNTFVGSYTFKGWNTTFVAAYLRSFTYQDNSVDLFSFDVSESYFFDANTSVSLGFSNFGSPLAANGQSNIVRVYDRNRSILYTNLMYTF
jgi:hypothetical protein